MPLISAENLCHIGCGIFQAAGTPKAPAKELVDALVEANLTGHDSHGVQYIPDYVEGIERSWIDPAAEPHTARSEYSTAVVDGGWGFGHITARYAGEVAVDLARRNGVGVVATVHCNHIGRVGRYAEQAAAAGCIAALFLGRTHPPGLVTPFGGSVGALAPNVVAFGVPAGDRPAMIIDFATSTVAQSKIKLAKARGDSIPTGWIVDKEGRDSTNPLDLDDGGWMLPFGGHKGYALSLLAAALGGLATGANTSDHMPPDANNPWGYGGLLILCLDSNAFVETKIYQDLIDRFFTRIREVPPAAGFSEVLIPGDPERRQRRQREKEGIPVPDQTWKQIVATATRLGVEIDSWTKE